MSTINTRLSKLLNVDVPIVCAPMAFAGTIDLAYAVSSSGGFDFIPADASRPQVETNYVLMVITGFDTAQVIKEDLQAIRQKLQIPPDQPLPVGVGFIGWILDMVLDTRLEEVLDEKPVALWLAFGVDLGKYVARVRAHDNKRDHKTIIFVIVNSVESALKAANEWKVDILVVQGTEAGGHGGSESPPLLSLLPAVLDALPKGSGPLIIAAGGISDGRQIAGLLTIGADGVALGTRFLFTPECKYNEAQKEVLLDAGLNDTVRTLAYDEVGRTNYWPPKHNGRAIRNKVMDDLNEGLDLESRLKRFDDSEAAGESSRLIVWAGVGAGLTNKISPASDVIRDLRQEILDTLGAASKLL